jgi:lysophospholipase L1-like esterase
MPSGYEIRVDGGTPIDVGNVLAYLALSLTPGVEHDFEGRSYDENGVRSGWTTIISAETLPLLFDLFSSTHLAIWSTRQYISTYTGPFCRVERASDSVQQDIDFVDGVPDLAAYAAFGTGTEKIVKIYDQSGNNLDQVLIAGEPTLIISPYNGKPCIDMPSTVRFGISGWTDWNGLADWNFFCGVRHRDGANHHLFAGGADSREVQIANGAESAGLRPINWMVSASAYNQYRVPGFRAGRALRFQFDGGAASDDLQARFFFNNIEMARYGSAGDIPTTLPNETGFYLNGRAGGGGLGVGNNEWFYAFAIGQDISASERDLINDTVAGDYFTRTDSQIICEGDSLTQGGVTSVKYPTRLKTLLEAETSTTWNTLNQGAASATFALSITANGLPQVDDYRDQWMQNDIAVLWAGTNDLYISAGGAGVVTQVLDDTVDWVNSRLANGFEVYVLNMLPRSDVQPGSNPTFAADRASFNSQLPTVLAGLATVVDVAGRPELDDETDPTYFSGDDVHISDAGNQVVAQTVFDAIQPNL